jgi:hypothetical protein
MELQKDKGGKEGKDIIFYYDNSIEKEAKIFEFENNGKTYAFVVIPHDDTFSLIWE